MNNYIYIITLLILFFNITYNYDNMTDAEVDIKSNDIYNKIQNLTSLMSYTTIKNKFPWIDSIIYTDLNNILKTHNNSNITINDIKKIIN
jgi:hypothetical protein